ncbi:hypothetical protein [Hyalangium rubrum]|uniref:Uncharacterized protein n=1 Tax=Hyalangium rubrum TaxID=3103134 RepID=A0ABU5H9I4_9BACT|nr:hypothetical protein [Hyalangium sp. s54d21]MDY7229437.1 hypothetical protein [Hyalangium sp. s54d21]
MTKPSPAPVRSSLGLRLVHAAVFLAFAAAATVAALPEWRHGLDVLGRAYHVGTPPRAVLVLGSVLAVAGASSLLFSLLRNRSAPMVASWLILGGLVASIVGTAGSPEPERPTEVAANTALIQLGQRVQVAMVSQLQERGEVPVALGPWQHALERVAPPGRFRTRGFRAVPPQVVAVATPEALPAPLLPGALLLHVSSDGASFELRLVGLSQGEPQVLRDETGAPVVLRGLFNPSLPATPARSLP